MPNGGLKWKTEKAKVEIKMSDIDPIVQQPITKCYTLNFEFFAFSLPYKNTHKKKPTK